MKKKNRKLLIIVLLLVASFVILSNFTINTFSIVPPSGFTPISLSSVNVTTDSSTGLSGDLLLMSFVSGGLGQSAYGNIDAPVINEKIDGTVSKGYEFSSNLVSQRCTYPFKEENTFKSGGMYNYVYKYYGYYVLPASNLESDCSQYGDVVAVRTGLEAYCVYRNQVSGQTSSFINPYYFFWVDNKLQIDGQSVINAPITNSIGFNESYSSGKKLGDVGFVQWNGNLSTGQDCDETTPSNYVVYNKAVGTGQDFVITTKSSVDAYSSTEINGISDLESGVSAIDAVNIVNRINNSRANVVSSETTAFGGNIYNEKIESGFDGAYFYVPSTAYELPTFSLFLKADSLGFRQPEPVPANVRLSIPDMTSGSGSGTISWSNIGATGNFSVSVVCDGASVSGVQTGVSVAENSSDSFSFSVSRQTSSEVVVNCTGTVTGNSFSQPSASDTDSFTVSPDIVCSANQKVCDDSNPAIVLTCKSDGSGYLSPTYCSEGQTCSGGFCIDAPSVCGDGICESDEYLTCPSDCLVPPSTCTSGVDCPDDLCRAKEGDGLFVLGYEPDYGLFGEYVGCEPTYNVALIVSGVIILGVVIIGLFVFQPFNIGKKRRRR